MVAKGEFPKPIKLGKRSVGWLESDVDAWIEACIKKAERKVKITINNSVDCNIEGVVKLVNS
uniref:helix-turn-helix transcriptional regulator n=1 Tax=Rickettsiella massiliensis TaxID=676517 RepID=UPI00029AFF12|nr:AlpA family phage regulatory protein [Rickettsiella massiliensis]